MQKALNSWAQRGDDQSGLSLTTMSTRACGMGVGRVAASGTACRKVGRLLRERKSAAMFSTPGRWVAWIWISQKTQKTCTLACASWSCPLFGQSSLLPQLPYYHNSIWPVCQTNIYPIAPLRRELEVAPLWQSAIPLPGPPTSTETTKDPNEPHTPMNLRHHSPGVLLLAVHWASR